MMYYDLGTVGVVGATKIDFLLGLDRTGSGNELLLFGGYWLFQEGW